jgi:hypothetical protein
MRYEKDSARGGKFQNRTVRTETSQVGRNTITVTTLINDAEKDRPVTTVNCSNEDYHFLLKRDGADSPFVLMKYGSEKPRDDAPVTTLAMYAYDVLRQIADAAEGRKGYELKLVRWDDRKQLLNVHLAVTTTIQNRGTTTQEHDIWLDPNDHWRVAERILSTPTSVTRITIGYGPPIDGLPYPNRITETVTPQGSSDAPAFQIRSELKTGQTRKTPSDFRLSAFGLPEPVDSPHERRVPSYVWFGTAAAFCAALALGFWYLAAKRRPRLSV